jgi:single-stranded-DNA-specific exonuclease
MPKQWKLLPKISEEIEKQFPDMNPVCLQLLHNRNISTQEQIDEFFNSDYIDDIHDPFILKDMKKAVKRIFKALEKKEEVLIYGDYDADGVTSSALLHDILEKIGIRAEVYIPHRETEGYGFNMKSVAEIIEKKFTLVVSCDCGVSNFTEIEALKKAGIDVIITDHHQEPEKLPPALAIVHAGLKREKYPCTKLAGVGIAYKLATGLLKSKLCKLDDKEKEKTAKWLLDLVALGTVADMVPLVGENRTLVKYGLKVLRKTKRLGLQELYKISGTKVETMSSYTIGFQIGPRLNAAGRIDHANTAYQLLITDNLEEAIKISNELNAKNRERQDLTKEMVAEAKESIGLVNDEKKMIWVKESTWNLGIIGLVAGRLSNEFYRPSFALGYDGQNWVCSSRGIDELDLMEVIKSVSDKLIRFGGHKSAAGFSLNEKNLEAVQKEMEEFINKKLKGVELTPSVYLDAEISLGDIDWDLWKYLDKFEPFGMNNKKPKFLIKDCLVKDIQFLGADKNHLKLTLEKDGVMKKAIGFRMAKNFTNLRIGNSIDLVAEIGLNEWNGNRSLELYIEDIKIK